MYISATTQRGVVDVIFFSRGFGHARLIHFLFYASEYRLVGFLIWLVFIHTCTMSRVRSDYRSIGNRAGSFRIVFGASSFAQSVPICDVRSEEHTSELQSLRHLVCRLL